MTWAASACEKLILDTNSSILIHSCPNHKTNLQTCTCPFQGLGRRRWYIILGSAYARNKDRIETWLNQLNELPDYICISELKDGEISSQCQGEASVVIDIIETEWLECSRLTSSRWEWDGAGWFEWSKPEKRMRANNREGKWFVLFYFFHQNCIEILTFLLQEKKNYVDKEKIILIFIWTKYLSRYGSV